MAIHSPSSIVHPRRILIRGVNWLGDAVMTTPALLRLREKFPDAYISLLTPEKLKDLWLNHPAVNQTILLAPGETVFAVVKKLRRWGERTREPLCMPKNETTPAREDARPTSFDLVLVLPNSPRSAIEMWLARIPRRIGYARPWRNPFLTHAVPPRVGVVKMRKRSVAEIRHLIANPTQNSKLKIQNFSSHQIHEYLHLAAALGANPEPLAPQLFVAPEEIEAAKKKFRLESLNRTGGTPVPLFGLNPGAEYGPAKCWPIERFIAVVKEIQQRTNCVWLIFGGKNDSAIATEIQLAIGNRQLAINLAGQTSLRELMTLLKLCRVLLTNDSGPMHVAAALGTPVVVPFGSTSPELTGPGLPGDPPAWPELASQTRLTIHQRLDTKTALETLQRGEGPRHRLLKSDAPCSPCFLRECPIDFRCMTGISVERVVEAVISAQRR
jgi:heptosyltransferase-2